MSIIMKGSGKKSLDIRYDEQDMIKKWYEKINKVILKH
jgi:hypothetical protein